MNSTSLKNELEKRGLKIDDSVCEKLEQYRLLLASWNERMNLTAIKESEEVYEKHFFDSLLPLTQMQIEGKAIDVGSGAGFPGLVMKIVSKDTSFTLLEPIKKRCLFLNTVIQELGLDGIEVVNERAEDYAKLHRESFDFVTARAVSNLNILAELCIPLVKIGGTFLAMKGSKGKEEHKEAAQAIHKLGATLKNIQEEELSHEDKRINLFYQKERATEGKYPRSYSLMKKKPLK
ncbi:MAG: 16S rRNA (guanine(527)-N(7))-methyltransferase RsmG [Solobacterium sp.]|nr:16S rRNA (guanine(527)-N(7))-methyltransferase RsmG [Solobacterium sp.]